MRRAWARLIQKVFEVDPLVCSHCQGRLKVIRFIEDGETIRKILEHLGLWLANARPIPKAHLPPDPCSSQLPARYVEDFSQIPLPNGNAEPAPVSFGLALVLVAFVYSNSAFFASSPGLRLGSALQRDSFADPRTFVIPSPPDAPTTGGVSPFLPHNYATCYPLPVCKQILTS